MYIKEIKLKDAMTREIDFRCRSWTVSGNKIDEDIPENEIIEETIVNKHYDGTLSVLFKGYDEKNKSSYVKRIAQFSTLEELQEKYPQLFELVGQLYAFF